MSSPDIQRKRNDTAPITGILKSNDERASLENATEVRFYVSVSPDDELLVDGIGEVVNASEGRVRYEPMTTDFDETGFFIGEWEVEYANGDIQSFPNTDFLTIEIFDDLS